MQQVLYLIFCSFLGYKAQNLLNHPDSKLYKRLPNIKLKFIQFTPNVKIFLGNKEIHIHHWFTYSVVLIITVTFGSVGILETMAAKGFLAGSVIQGLTFSDWKKMVKDRKRDDRFVI